MRRQDPLHDTAGSPKGNPGTAPADQGSDAGIPLSAVQPVAYRADPKWIAGVIAAEEIERIGLAPGSLRDELQANLALRWQTVAETIARGPE